MSIFVNATSMRGKERERKRERERVSHEHAVVMPHGWTKCFCFHFIGCDRQNVSSACPFLEEGLVIDSVDIFVALVLDSAMDIVWFLLRT